VSLPTKSSSYELYKRLLGFLKPYRPQVIVALTCMIFVSLTTVGLAYLIKPIIDGAFLKSPDPMAQYHHLLFVTLPLAFVLAVLRAASTFGQSFTMGYLSQRVVQAIRDGLYKRFITLPIAFFTRQTTGGLGARITNDVLILQESVTSVLGTAVSSTLMMVSLVGYVLYLDWKLALVALVAFPLAFYPIIRFGKKMRHASGEGQALLAELNAQIHETFSGIRVVKAFGREEDEEKKFRDTNHAYWKTSLRSIRASALSSPIVEAIGVVAFLALIWWLSRRAIFVGDITPGGFISFGGALFALYKPLKDFNGVWGRMQTALAAAERCFEILDTPDEQSDTVDAVEVSPLSECIEFQNVSFEYLPGRPVLQNVSFKLRRGEIVALVGSSGGGKSTLADLIPRFYRPTSGCITWDGVDISHAKASSLRKHIGIVTQETILFHGSIRHNVAYGRPDATEEQIEAAAKDAYADGFVRETTNGYDTLIGERGARLSGGQRQRLAIARALLKDPPVLILDEATSALDTESERLVQLALDRLMGERTTLVIAHRLSTIQRANRIMVLDHGHIAEEGTHEQLLAKDGLYAKLYKMQFREPRETVKLLAEDDVPQDV
jgi:subfamily B ATP-binding cassette protein MsbA